MDYSKIAQEYKIKEHLIKALLDLDELPLLALKTLAEKQREGYLVWLKGKTSTIDDIRYNQGAFYALDKFFNTIDKMKKEGNK